MREIGWTPKSMRAFKRLVRKSPQLRPLIEDPSSPNLRTHKLMGDLSNVWSCSIDYSYRILFEFVKNDDNDSDAILLLNIGSHNEVY